MDKGAAKAERGTPAPRGVQLWQMNLHCDQSVCLSVCLSTCISQTSLCCCWQTHTMQCLSPTDRAVNMSLWLMN